MSADEQTDDQALYRSVLDLMRLIDFHNLFKVSPIMHVEGTELVKIEVAGLQGTAFLISSIEQIDSVVAFSQALLSLESSDKP